MVYTGITVKKNGFPSTYTVRGKKKEKIPVYCGKKPTYRLYSILYIRVSPYCTYLIIRGKPKIFLPFNPSFDSLIITYKKNYTYN